MNVVKENVVIIGAGHAGLTLAREVRAHCQSTPITIISREPVRGYYKPNLSKALSMGKTPDQLVMKEGSTIAAELNVQLLGDCTVTRIDAENRVVFAVCEGSDEVISVPYASLVLATGANPMKLPVECSPAVERLTVNTLQDYENFRNKLKGAKRVLIIGAGFVGCELASDLVTNGYAVDVVDMAEWPLQRSMPEVMGTEIKKAMAEQGVRWHLGLTLESLTSQDGVVKTARLSNDEVIETDLIVSAVGLAPNIKLASEAGISVGRGIVVDESSETSQKGIFALGDCVEYLGVTMPFIAPATHAAKALAKTLTGKRTALELPAMPVAVKISACPTVICPSLGKKGIWQVRGAGRDLEAHFINEDGRLSGFSLTGQCISKKGQLASECLPTLPPIASISDTQEAVA
ncbi:NAD(P)/FAD-dependent oxidoreductase [Alkalimarinus coralli]|uniref:NAD(P)/FAD-dependent oxidoreductase n=1 Tax=Alkalimarinus coralli TaxID=2935863 RepID=UPI00202B7A9F|nr:FAD-dependent oxidoreductase [Alkalimarinus coralli]